MNETQTQTDIFDDPFFKGDGNEGIRLSFEANGPEWNAYALEFVRKYAMTHELVFCDDVWRAGLKRPTSPRGFGGVMKNAELAGYIGKWFIQHGYYVAKDSKASKGGPKPVWISKIYKLV